MKLSGDLQFKIGLTVVVLAGTGLALWYAKRQVGKAGAAVLDTAKAVIPYVNPADRNNVVYSGVNAVGGAVTGEAGWSVGGALYDFDQWVDKLIFGAPPPPPVQLEPDFGIKDPGAGWD